MTNRREFIKSAAIAALSTNLLSSQIIPKRVKVGAHLWVYASKYPPDWDCTPIIDQVFSDLTFAGVDGVELMHTNLRHANAVEVLGDLVEKYELPIFGSSYGADMWQESKHSSIREETEMLFEKMKQLNAKHFGISVGDAGRKKTEEELDSQAAILRDIRESARKKGITCNLHNHTYEVINHMHDLRGTLKRIPDFPLGPDLNWLIRGGVNPIEFIREFRKQIVYLHIRDQYLNVEWTEAVGEDNTDFKGIAFELEKVKFRGVATIELAFPNDFKPTRPLRETWKISRQNVRKQFGY